MYQIYSTPSYGSTVLSDAASVWVIIAMVLALVGGLVAYFLFVRGNLISTANKFWTWLRTFLRFDQMVIEDIIKIAYLVLALFITLSSFALIPTSFLSFLFMLIFGNIFLRVAFEFVMLSIMIWRNTNDIRRKVVGESQPAAKPAAKTIAAESKPAADKPATPAEK